MKFYLVAGEASGDLHASNLIQALRRLLPDALFRGIGGDRMQEQGMELFRHFRDTAFMGFVEVVRHLPQIIQAMAACKRDIERWRPDVLILVDYPGFNLRIARWAKQQGYRVHYYISPQVWAWKPSRVYGIRRSVDLMMVILPFEEAFYRSRKVPVHYVGHPLLDALEAHQGNADAEKTAEDNLLVLMPGSRRQEIASMLPAMLEATADFAAFRRAIAGIGALGTKVYLPYLKGHEDVELVWDQTYALLAKATAAVVTSGTATLEAALFSVPQVVCYKGSMLSYTVARWLVRVPYISLVNLLLQEPLVPELIQRQMTARNIRDRLQTLLFDEPTRQRQLQGYARLRAVLGEKGASQRAAHLIIEHMQ